MANPTTLTADPENRTESVSTTVAELGIPLANRKGMRVQNRGPVSIFLCDDDGDEVGLEVPQGGQELFLIETGSTAHIYAKTLSGTADIRTFEWL